jgi:DTW domain-containing protein YfiP
MIALEDQRRMRGRRLPRCAHCGLPVALCLCDELVTVHNRVPIVVVMHPIEAVRTSNTGRLAVRSLARAEICIRGVGGDDDAPPAPRRLVLFPERDARPLTAADAHGELSLVVPDGSWRQARRIARRDPWARGAEMVRLTEPPPTRYPLRRNYRAGALSTFEAIAHALTILEGPELAHELMPIFDRFVERVLSLRSRPQPVRLR